MGERRTNTDGETKDGQAGQSILDNVRLAGTVEGGGGPVVLVVVRRLLYSAVVLARCILREHICCLFTFRWAFCRDSLGMASLFGSRHSHVQVGACQDVGWVSLSRAFTRESDRESFIHPFRSTHPVCDPSPCRIVSHCFQALRMLPPSCFMSQ